MADSVSTIASSYEKYKEYFATDTSTALDQSDFLTLMVEQLKNQDFNNPTDNTEFIAQMAQFSTLQSQQLMTQYTQVSYATSLVGKTVVASTTNASGQLTTDEGIVSAVKISGDEISFVVNGSTYAYADIQQIKASTTASTTDTAVQATGSVDTTTVDTLTSLSGTPTYTIGFLDGKQTNDITLKLVDAGEYTDQVTGYAAGSSGSTLTIELYDLAGITSTSDLVTRINAAITQEQVSPLDEDNPVITTTNFTAGKISITVDSTGITRYDLTSLTADDITLINQAAAKTIIAQTAGITLS